MSNIKFETLLYNGELDENALFRRKNRIKDIHSGKTRRKIFNSWKNDKNPTIETHRIYSPMQGNLIEVLITQVDHDLTLEPPNTISNNPYTGTRFVENGANLWDKFENSIKTNAISNIKNYNSYNQNIIEKFEVPVIDTVIVRTDYPTKHKYIHNKKWFRFNGKSYDPSLLYRANESYTILTALGPNNAVHTFENSSIVELRSKTVYDEKLCYIVNFNKPQIITNIGTIGESPVISRFNGSKSLHKDSKRMRKLHHWINIVSHNHPTAYVTSYKLEYYDIILKKWIYIGKYTGNIDAFNLHVIEIPQIITKALRFTVDDFKIKPHMRISIYGKPINIANNTSIGVKEHKDTFTYEIEHISNKKYGYKSSRRNSWDESKSHLIKRELLNFIKEEQDLEI